MFRVAEPGYRLYPCHTSSSKKHYLVLRRSMCVKINRGELVCRLALYP